MTAPAPAAPERPVRREVQRKAIHMATAIVPVAYAAGLSRGPIVAGCAALTGIAVLVEVSRRLSPAMADRFTAWTGPLLRPHEAAGDIAGATWLFAAFTLVAWGTAPAVAVTAMWAVAAGDGAAAVVGRALGRTRVTQGKTLEGSLAMLLMTAAGAWGLAGWSAVSALGLGVAAALAELPARPLNDNLRVALVVGATGTLIVSLTH